MRRALYLLSILSVILVGGDAAAEDPLDGMDGTEGWGEIDTSSVDENAAWRQWRFDLRRWAAGRARMDAEREIMRHAHGQVGGTSEPDAPPSEIMDERSWQAHVDAARASTQVGSPERRDAQGQSIDDERPWSRR